MTQTDMVSPALAESFKGGIPMGRLGHPEEIAEAVAFLLSPAAPYRTGSVVTVSGRPLTASDQPSQSRLSSARRSMEVWLSFPVVPKRIGRSQPSISQMSAWCLAPINIVLSQSDLVAPDIGGELVCIRPAVRRPRASGD